MKKLLLPIIVLITVLGCEKKLNYTKSLEYIKEENNILYYKEKPFSGILFSKHKNGQIYFEKIYKDGVILDDLYFEFDENGNIVWSGNYKDGKLNGPFKKKYRSGSEHIKEIGNYKNGELSGLYENYFMFSEWDRDYKLKESWTYKDGEKDGPFEINEWSSNEKIESKTKGNYKNGELNGLHETYGPLGDIDVLTRYLYKDGKKDGPFTEFYGIGRVENEGTYKNGELNGLYETYNSSGFRTKRMNYKDGKLDGPYEVFRGFGDNGLKKRMYYKEGVLIE